MTTYARKEDGWIIEIFPPTYYDVEILNPENPEEVLHKVGDEIPIEARFHPDFVAGLEVVPDDTVVQPAPQRQPTPEEALAAATTTRDSLLAQATLRIAPLQDAVDLDEATADETALLKKWKQYRVALNRIDLTVQPITWPEVPQ